MTYRYRKPSFKEKLGTFWFKSVLILITTLFCFIPAELWYGMYKFASPVGFWEKFAITGLGIVVFGGFQLVCFIFWMILLFIIITED